VTGNLQVEKLLAVRDSNGTEDKNCHR